MCERQQCLITHRLCQKAELWVNQDYVGQNSVERLGNSASDFGDSLSFLDICMFHHPAPVEPDWDTAAEAWEKVKTLRLKPKHLEILRLFYVEGKRLRDCALALRIPDQSAWARKKKAVEQVGDRLRRLEYWKRIRPVRFDYYWPVSHERYREISRYYFRDLLSTTEITEIYGCGREWVNKVISKVRKSLV